MHNKNRTITIEKKCVDIAATKHKIAIRNFLSEKSRHPTNINETAIYQRIKLDDVMIWQATHNGIIYVNSFLLAYGLKKKNNAKIKNREQAVITHG